MKIRLEGIEIECNVDEFEEIRKRNLLDVNIKKNLECRKVEFSEITDSVVSVFRKYGIKYIQREMEVEKLLSFETEIKNSKTRIIFIQPNEVKIFRYLGCVEPYSCDDMIVETEERLELLKEKLSEYIQEDLQKSLSK